MSPVLIVLILILMFTVYILLSFLYKPIGRFITKILDDFTNIINEEETEDN